MTRRSKGLESLPPAVLKALKDLGENLSLARLRRREPQRIWAERLSVSLPTLIRMEQGDAAVSVGVYATALWLIGKAGALAQLAAPTEDTGALESDVRAALKRRAVRSRRKMP